MNMKTATCIIVGVLLTFMHSIRILRAQTNSDNYVWSDGFLEKQYAETNTATALADLFHKCVQVQLTILTRPIGTYTTIQTYGAGDNNGEFQLGVKGAVIIVKRIEKEKTLTVGFKVGDGDRKASEALHRLLASKLDTDRF